MRLPSNSFIIFSSNIQESATIPYLYFFFFKGSGAHRDLPFSPTRRSSDLAFGCLARGGTIVTCGATAGPDVTLNLWPFFVKQQRLIGSYGRNAADFKATLDWASQGKLQIGRAHV